MSPPPAGRRLFARRWQAVLVVVVVAVAILIAVLHAPIARDRVLAMALARLRDAGIVASAERLDYNLFPLTIGLRRVTLAGAQGGEPFLRAEAVRVNLPWSIVTGTLRIQSLEIEGPVITVTRDAQGALNLPGAATTTTALEEPAAEPTPTTIPEIERLAVRNLQLHYADAGTDVSIDGGGLTLEAQLDAGRSLRGRLTMSEALRIRAGDQSTAVTQMEGGVALTGTALEVDALALRSPELQLRLDGSVDILASDPTMSVEYAGRFDLARLAPWADLEPVPAGTVAFSGQLSGPLAEPVVALEASGDALSWSTLSDMSLRTRGSFAGSVATIESFEARLAGGSVAMEGRVPVGEPGAARARVRWSDIDVGVLAGAAGADLPVRLASIATGRADLDWTGSNPLAGTGSVENRLSARRATRGDLPLEGRLTLGIDAGTWRLALDHQARDVAVLSGTVHGRLVPDDLAASTIDGRATVRVGSLQSAVARLARAGIAIGESAVTTMEGAIDGDVALGGTLGSPRIVGTLDANGVQLEPMAPARAQARIVAADGRLAVDGLRVEIGPNLVTGTATIGLESKALRGTVTGDLPALAALAPGATADVQLAGAARLEARLGGTYDNPDVDATLRASDVLVAGQMLRRASMDARLAGQVVTVDRLEVTQDEGRLNASGRYALASGRYTFSAEADDFTITPLVLGPGPEPAPGEPGPAAAEPVPIDARFGLRLNGTGTVAAPAAQGVIEFSRLAWGPYQVGSARADLAVEGGTARLTAGMPDLPAKIDATVSLDEPRTFAAVVDLMNARLSRIARAEGPAAPPEPPVTGPVEPDVVTGSVSLRAEARGQLDDVRAATVDLDLRLVDVAVNGASLRMDRPARLRYAAGDVFADDVELHIGDTVVSAEGRFGGPTSGPQGGEDLQVTLVGSIGDLVPFMRLAPGLEEVDASGGVNLRLRASGELEAPVIDAELALVSGRVTTPDLPAVSDASLRASYARGLLDLQELRAAWQGATLTASGQAPATLLGDRLPAAYAATLPELPTLARASIRVDSLTPAALEPFLDRATLDQIAGRIDVVATLEAGSLDIAKITGQVTLEQAALELASVPFAQTRPSRLRLADGRLEIEDWTWAGGGNQFRLGGSAAVASDPPELDFTAAGTIDLRMLGAFVPDVATTGTASLDVTVTGPASKPQVAGRVGVRDSDIIIRDPRVAITDLEGTLTLAGDRLELTEVTANANGGSLRIAGSIAYPDFTLSGGTITITARGLALELPEDFRSEIDADLIVGLSGPAPSITGEVTILGGEYREPISLAGQLLGAVDTSVVVSASDEEPGLIDRVTLSVDVVSEEDIVINNNYGRLNIGSNLKVAGTLGAPVLAGRLTIQEGGKVFLGGRTYDVVRGTVDFTSATRIEPNIDLSLETRVQRYDITLDVTGTPEALEVDLRAPGASQADVVSLLLTGQLADEAAMAQTEIARGQLLMLLSGELLSFAGRAVGLDTVQVGRGLGGAASDFDLLATDSDPGARLTIAKNVSRNVEVVFSQSLTQSGNITWIAIYRPLRNIDLRFTTEDDNSRAYEFRHELNFRGATTPRPTRASRDRAADARVTAVRFSGTPGFSEPELAGRLRLEAGDRFDFYRWQQDRDRLLAFYHERGYLEAKVKARRIPLDSGDGVELEYELDRGPATRLVVEGYSPSTDLLDEMRDLWGSAVFDGFLIEDFTLLIRRALVADGHLQADVTADISSDPDGTKVIAVRAVPGTRFDDRRITFSGNQQLASEVLQQFVEDAALEVSAWLDPAEVESAIEARYRAEGNLAADVTVAPPVFAGGSAVLPVQVQEGQPFVVQDVQVQGAKFKPEAEVREAFGIEPGAGYRPDLLEPARQRVELLYLRAGFNDARASVTSLVDRDRSRVGVALSIDEGFQQVLSSVSVTGARTTSPGVVDRALGLDTGQPATRTDTYRAQKRLYDTGVFRNANVELEPVGEMADETGVQPVRAAVTLEELPLYRLRYGVRLNDAAAPSDPGRQIQPALVADLYRRNLFGRAIATGIGGQVEADRRFARGIVTLPSLFTLPVTTSLFVTQSREEFTPEAVSPFLEDAVSISVEQRFRPATTMAVTYGYRFDRTHVFETDPNPDFPLFDLRANVARLTATYTWNTRDDPSNARRGWLHSSGFEYGTAALGSDLRFVRYLSQQYYFVPVGENVVLGSAFRLGVGKGFGQDLIASEKFYAGGGTSVRGFAQDGLGGTDFFGDPSGGNALLTASQEVRFPVFRWVRGVAFLDAGNVFPRASDLSFADLEAGAGFGLRIDAPFALLRVDFGVPLTRRDREPSGRWYFGFGHTF